MVGVGDVGGGNDLNVGKNSAAKIAHLYENAWHNRRFLPASVYGLQSLIPRRFLFDFLLFKRCGRSDIFSAVHI